MANRNNRRKPAPAKPEAIYIPAPIRKAFEEYGFSLSLDNAVSTRARDGWFAVLFPEGEAFCAVDFGVDYFSDTAEVQNDYIGPFASIEEFQTEGLKYTLI